MRLLAVPLALAVAAAGAAGAAACAARRPAAASGREFYVDAPLQPKETRRIETPRNEQVVRAYASTEAWRVERPGLPATYRGTGTQVRIRTGCAAA